MSDFTVLTQLTVCFDWASIFKYIFIETFVAAFVQAKVLQKLTSKWTIGAKTQIML